MKSQKIAITNGNKPLRVLEAQKIQNLKESTCCSRSVVMKTIVCQCHMFREPTYIKETNGFDGSEV